MGYQKYHRTAKSVGIILIIYSFVLVEINYLHRSPFWNFLENFKFHYPSMVLGCTRGFFLGLHQCLQH